MPRYFDPLLRVLMRSSEHELLAQIQFLKAENRMLRSRLRKSIHLTHVERLRLLSLGSKLRWSVLRELISVVHPCTFARWVTRYKGVRHPRQYDRRGPKVGRPATSPEIKAIVIRIARETGLGYTRIQGELNKLGIELSRTTITNILKGVGMSPDPHRGEGRWDEFLAMHAKTLWACDFMSVNALTSRGIKQFYMILFIHIASRRIQITPATMHPTRAWVEQQARNFCMEADQEERQPTHLIRDQDMKFEGQFNNILQANAVKPLKLPRHSPNLNAFAERAIQSLKYECLNHFVICGRRHLDHLVGEYVHFYNRCRPHSSIGRLPPVREQESQSRDGPICCKQFLGGLLKHYYREAA